MEISALFHKANSEYAYAYDDRRIHLKLKTKMSDVEEVYLIFGDPYDFRDNQVSGNLAAVRWEWHTQHKIMEKIGCDGVHDFWFVEETPIWRRMRYAFYLKSKGKFYLYGERKTVEVAGFDDIELVNQKNFFAHPFLNGVDVYKAPEWSKDAIWYQIFPERFENGDRTNDPDHVKPWDQPITSHSDHYGGDLQGICNQLDYLQELGINAIYLTPIFKSHSNHKYDTIDYLTVDPHFGDKALLKKLVDAAHAKGIKVMLDIVFNHCGFYFKPFQDVIEKGSDSIYKDWFHIKDFPVFELNQPLDVSKTLNFDVFAFTPMMPKINTENPETKAYLLDIIKYWSEEVAIDGWRLDVANEVDHQFWRTFREVVKACNPEAYIMGEVWHDAYPWLQGDQFDSVMNYPLNEAVLGFFAYNTIDTWDFIYAVNRTHFSYPSHVNESMYNLLDSHDTSRFLHLAEGNIEKMKLAYLFMFTHMGAPSIYYGNEIGMSGKQDPDCRRPMIWDPKKQDLKMLEFMKKLIHLRKEHTVLRHKGNFVFLNEGDDPDVVLYKRAHMEEIYYILMNRSGEEVEYPLPEELVGVMLEDLWEEQHIHFDGKVKIAPYGYYLLKKIQQSEVFGV